MQKGAKPQYLLPIKFLGGNTGYDGFAPRESIRIKMNGGGMNFVHGGISLQEMVVPVVEYHYLRNDCAEYKRNRQKTSDNSADRTFRRHFNLKSLKYSNTATYYLMIADEQGLQTPQRESFQIDIAFGDDEFDFFS